ncbi:MAG: hypothetical protein J7K34_00030 [Flavobacteriaceae bacterium]|nr:hypothetical protein [Flavobacteriaceae bacterium]
MKTKIVLAIVMLFFVLQSCNDETDGEFVLVNVATPKYMTKEALRSSVRITSPMPIIESGKIYVYNDLVLVNDIENGIHIIDNSNPKSPKKVACIKIEASNDMEIKGDYLYVDSLMDLVIFDISDINNIKEVARLKDVFPSYVVIPFMDDLLFDYEGHTPNSDEIIIGWKVTQERRSIEEIENLKTRFTDIVAFSEANVSVGQGGSLARFKIVGDYLYAVDSHNINIFNIDKLENPQQLSSIFAGFDIETIFNRGDYLFLGSMSGMFIYDIKSPATPQFVSEFQHGTACDPVVVDDDYAYITLRAGNLCGALDSSLQIVDITDLYNPKLKKSYSMDNPYGLGVKNNLLFICDGNSGLKVYDKTNVEDLQLIDHFKDINTFDVIPLDNRLLMIGEEVLYQYTYTENEINLLSQFSLD